MKGKKLLLIFLFMFSIIGCSSTELMLSSNAKNEIIIDGNNKDWEGKLKYFENKKASIGFQNDEYNLYFCFVTSNKSDVMKIMSLGLTVWFEPENSEQIIGLQYPKKKDKVTLNNLMGKNINRNNYSDFEMTFNAMMQNQNEFALIDENEKIIYTAPLDSNDGYKIKIGTVNQQFVYEAKIPIGTNYQAQMPIDIFPSEKVRIKFESGSVDLDAVRKNNNVSGVHGGGQKMRGNMQGGGRPAISRMGMEPFRLNVEVKLTN